MKPVITWVLLANARAARVFAHHGPGKGLTAVSGKTWDAPEPSLPRDKAGVGHSIAGPGVSAVAQTQPKDLIGAQFAKDIITALEQDYRTKHFERLILIAGPHMLGLMRKQMEMPLSAALLGEIPKDLSHQPLSDVETHLGELIAV